MTRLKHGIEPSPRMGPPPRSLAAEANDCFMVWPRRGLTESQGAARSFARQWQAPLGSFDHRNRRCRQSHTAPSNKAPNIMSQA